MSDERGSKPGLEGLHLALAKLPPGRHGLPREFVVANQRTRLLAGLVGVAADRGYAGVSVKAIIAAAGVSRRTFFEHFEGREDCFRAAYEEGLSEMKRAVGDAGSQGSDRRTALEARLAALLGFLESEPELARVCLVESLAAGIPPARGPGLLEEVVWADGDGVELGPQERALVGGIEGVVRERVRRANGRGLGAIGPELADLAARLAPG